MPLDNSKLKKVYATLQQGGYKQDYNTFLKGFTGNDHYENRKKVYDLLSANGAQIGDSYEEFMKKMQVAPAPAKSTTPTTPTKPTPAKPKETPLTEADRQKMLDNVGNMMAETNASIQRTQNRMDYARANAGLRVPRVTIGGKNSGVRLGQNSKVVAKKPQYNPKSGKMEQTYITESGNEFTDRGAADLEQNTIDAYKDSMSVSGQLRDAYAERDRLDEAMKKRMKEIDERPYQRFNDFMRESAAAMTPGAGPAGELEARMSKYDNDDEYLQLMAAARKNHQTIQLLEDKKNNQMNSFWHSLGTTALNGYTFTDGMSEMRDATALTRASKHIDSINRKRAAGKPLTREEQTAEAVLKNFATNNAVQGMYGGDYGAWARAGGMTANSLDFMKDLMLNPGAGSMAKGIMRGTAKGMAKGLAKVTGKEAAQLWKNNVVRRTLKATGVLIGAHMAGAYVSNTTGIGRTAATMGTLASGKVGVDDNGNYTVENAMGLLPAFAEAERQQARENGSEMFGEFIPGVGGMVKKGLEKIGLSKLSGAMTNIGNKEWYKQYSRLLESGGYNGLPGEALEEYEGSLFDALTGHAGDAWDDMTNLQNHVDIWLGCATMGALLGSVPMMMQGHHTAQYYRYKHNTDKADNLASFRMTAERWAPLRDKIDNTDNSKMADVVTGIINNPDLHPEEKKAALNYVRNLTMMRGYNIAQVNNASDDEEQRPEVQSVNDNYSKGYDTTEPQAMNDAKNLLDMKREQVAKEHGIENVDEVDALIGDDPLRYIEEQKQLGNTDKLQSVIDYANAKSAYDGMVQRVQDDIDSRIEETNATVDSRVNRHDGMIHPASLKLQNEDGTDKKVYIVSGNVVMFDDGKGVDREKSDNTIVIRDVETGEMKVIPPDLIRGLDAAVDPEEEKARAREAIIEEMSQTAANNVDGVVSFNEGDTYTLTDENGEQTQVTLVANEQGLVDNGDGTVNVTVDGQNVVPMSMEDIQGGVDATNMARTVQAEQERQANGESVEEKPDGVQYGVNDTFTLLNGEDKIIHGEVQGVSDDGVEIRTDEPLNGKYVQVIPAEEFENNVESINDADGNQVWAREYAEDAAATEEVSDSTEPLDHDLVAPATPTTEELVQMARGGNELAQHQLEAQGVQWKEAIEQQTALSRVPINEETGEPMFEKADRETALDALNEITGGNDENTTAIVRAQVEQATKALDALKKKQPTKKAPALKGSPMAMVKAQQEAEANYNTAMQEYDAKVAAAEENLNAWSRINSLMNDRKRAIREQQEAERKVREEKLHAEAVARLEEDKRIAAEKAAEQEAVGTHAVNPKIKAKWDGATKVEGNPNAITLADGSTIRGHYVLTEAGAATASHDVNNAYEPTEGFPVDENGESVNDRDYKRDKDAQRIVRDMADSYDSRALQTPVIVSKDGVVLSGNNRTMSGDIAAQQGTDKAYIDHLREFGQMYGFTPEQIDGMKHPRVVFVPDEHLPYDATTFARFNAEQQKKQSKPEHAVKLGKIVPGNVFTSITNDISRFDRMSDYYADDKSVASAISQLLDAGVINEMQLPELRTGNALSAAGKELIDNTLIGKVFQTSPDAVRQIISTPTLRQSVVMGLNEIANNRTLAKSGYDLSKELAAAVDLVSRAKSDSPEIYKEGMPVSPYGRQQGLFDDEYGDSRVTDGVTLLLADLLNSGKPSDLRKFLSTYNNEAASSAAGQIDMFSGDVTSKEEILKNVNEYFRNATPKEQQALIDAAVAERKRRAEAPESAGGDEASEQATVVAGSDAEPQQPVVASEEPVKGNEADADALAKEAEEKLSERITDTEDEWTEPSEYGEIYKHRMFVDGKEVIKVDAPDKSKNYPGTYYEIDGKQFGDLYEVANYIDGNEQPLSAKIEAASAEVNTNPTEAQKEAGNYKKGHVQVGTFDITIEQPQGSVRKGTDADGKQWESKMNNTYGYIRGAVGVDGDHIDVFLSNDIDGWNGRKVFVVDQYNPDGSFDEHKVMLGFNDVDEAKSDYLANYESGWENGRWIDVSTVNLEDFEKWIASSKRKTKAFSEYSLVKKETVGNSFDDFVRDSGGEVIPNGVTRSNVINFAERVLEKYHSHTESYGTYNAKRTDVEIPANKLFKSESELFTAKNGNSIAVNDTQAKARYELVAHKDAQGHLKSVSVIKYHDFDYNDAEPLAKSVKKDVVEINAPEEAGYSITPSTYTNKKGKTSDVSLLTFDHDLTADQERAVKEFAKERTGEGRFAPARGWKDRESGGWMFRSEEDARKAAEMVGNEEAVADNQPMTAQELRDAVEPKKPTASKKTAAKKPANRVEVADVAEQKPSEPTKAEQPKQDGEKKLVITDEMKHDEDILRELLGIGDEELDGGTKFRDPDAMTSQQRRFVYNAGVNYSLGYIDQGFVKFPEFAKAMVSRLGYKIKPWLKSFYEGAKRIPGYDQTMFTPTEEVDAFDVANFDKPTKDVMAQANMIVEEGKAQVAAEKANNELKATRNEQRKETEKQTAANTDAVAAEATGLAPVMWVNAHPDQLRHKPSESAEPKHEAVGDFYEDGINEDAVAALPEDTAIQLHVVDILNPGMTDHSMKSKIESLNTLLPKISDKKLSELDKEYGDDKDMGTHIKAEVARRAKDGGVQPTSSEKPADKPKPASKKNATKKVKPEQPVGDLFAGLFDEPNNNETADSNSSSPSQTVAGAERPDTVGIDETGTDGAERTTAVAGTDAERSTDASRENGREAADGAVHGTDEVGGIQPPFGNRGRDESTADRTVSNGATDERGRVAGPRTVQTGEIDGGGKGLSSGEPASSTGEGGGPATVKKQRTPVRKFTNNFHYGTDGNEADNYTPAQRLEGNVSAIEVIAKLFKEGRKATDEEKQILSRFRGWGQIDQLSKFYSVDQMRRDTYGNSPYRRLANAIDTLDPDGKKGVFAGIKRAALSSYYTPTKIASAMNSFLSLAGFKGGTFLDPSMGNGIFEGTLPKDIQERTMITGVELDWLSGQISRALYPDADVRICGFEKSELTPNSQDVVTSNVPFGDIEVNDPTWKNDSSPVKRSAQKRIHNYYAVKMLELTRPGGIVAMMTSPAVMDTQSNQHIRRYIAEQGEFLGAVRLPDNTFQGTGAMADIIYIRKWKDEEDAQKTRENPDYAAREQAFLSSAETTAPNKRNGEKQKVSHNAYYASNRKNMIGDVVAGNQYNDKSFGLHSELTTDQIAKEVKKAVKRIVGDRKGMLFDTTRTSREVKQAVREEYKGDGNWVSTGNLVIQDDKVGVLTATKNEYGEVTRVFKEQPQLAKQKKRIIAMGEVRTAMKELIAGQIEGLSDTKLNMLRAKLKRAYDEFVSKYGKLQDTDNAVVLSDIDGYTLRALEVWKGGKFQGLSDIFTKNTIKPALKLEDAKTPQEAIATSLAEYGEIRGEYIEKALGADWFEQCGGLVFKEPNATDRYVTRDEYLSGDVVAKLEEAKTAAATDPTFERNVKELEQAQPATIPFDDITIHLGARWIPQEVLNDFVKETLGLHASSSRNYEWVDGERREIIKSGVVYVPETDSFEINIEAKELGGQAEDWKTADKSIKEIFQAALEDKDFRIVRKDKDGNAWIDQEATELANSKVADLREHFEQWLPGDDNRIQTMERAYNDRFNRIVLRKWDGSHLNVPGLMGKELRPHQKDAVWMLINNRGGIVDHIVGAGKTLVMQSAIMEMRRMGIAKKPMIVALKSTVPQIARGFKEAYPTARVLAPSEKDFSTENRKKFFANISLNDYDCIIVSHEQYCKIPHSEEAENDVVNEQLAQLDAMIEYLYGTGDKSLLTKRQIKSLEKRRQNLHAKLEKRLDRSTDREFCFENMGIDYLFVDECHRFKSLPYVTSYQNVAGLGEASGSDKAVALLTGIRHLQKMHQGDKGTVFLSGTTITNSLVEIYNLLNYLRPHKLEQLGMPTFDAWASTFAVHTSELEAGVSNEFKMKDRFRYFDNVPELSQLYAEIADVRNDYNLQLPKPKVDGKTVIVPQSDAVAEINREVVDMLQTKDGSYFGIHPNDPKKFPWGLVASGISAKAAVSPRLVFPEMDDSVGKISYCCDNIKKSYDEMKEQKGVQLVFCELGVPSKDKNEYDAYHDIIDRLTKDYGIPREEIAYIQQAKKDTDKEALFQKVRDGKVRILIGGTQNMGTGVNVQTRITDLHMLTVPWQPADLEQCIGRGSRQGNVVAHDFLNNKVRVHYYATEGSLDLYKYQLLDAKGKMFTQFKMGTISGERSFDEGDADENGNIDPAQMVALLSGNPIIFEKSKQDKLVKKLKSLYNGFLRDQQRKRQNYETVTKKVEKLKRLISLSDSDVHDLQREGFKPDDKGTYPSKVKVTVEGSYYGQNFDKPKDAGQYILEQLKNNKKVVLAGFGQRADVVFVTGDDLLSSHYEVQIGGNNAWSIRYSKRMPQDPTQAGLVFRSLLEQIIHNNEVYHREYDTNSEMLKTMPKGDAPFPKQKELDEAIAKQKELDAEYNKLGQSEEDKTKFRLLDADDPKAMELESLPESELVPVYRNVQAFEDDALGSPMAFTDAETGERRTLEGRRWNYSAPPKVELTEEQQRKLDELNKNGYIMVNGKKSTELQINDGLKFVKPKTKEAQLQYFLKKNPEDKGLWAAYDPYDHAIETPLNTQFGEAYKRPNLVVVRSLIPKSEIDEPFHADYALLPTGAHQWNNGRTLYLSRWSKIDKVLTREEEAKLIDEYWKKHPGKREELKTHRDYNRFVPQVRRELEKMGYRFELDGKELTPEESLALDKQNWESRDVIPGREGHTPFISNEDIARINAKMAGKWVGEPKEAMESAMSERVTELSERLHTPVRIIRTEEEVAALPSVRQRRMKGSFNPMTGEVTIVVPNNANMADIENTFVHEVVGHDGLRVLFPDEAKLNNALDELYRVSKDEIRGTIDRMAQKMYDAEVDRIREKKRKEHVANGEDANASYYADMAAAHAEAGKKREQFKRDATEEYGADLAGRIGEKGFEKMSAEELTFWGKLKAMLQKALQKLLDGLKIPGKRKWGDKDWAFVLHEAYKRKKNGGKPTVFDAADTEVMRRKTGFGEMKFSDGKHEQNPQVATTIADMKQRVTELFEKAKTGEFVGKPASIGRLSVDGKAYLEKLSGLKFKEFVDFVLNPSDLNHIRSDHYGENEKDKGNNVPLTDEDIQNMVDVLNQPDGILYGVDKKDGRKLFFFLKDAGNGLYNLTEVCSTKKGNLNAKSFFKSKKKGISQRVMEIKDSLLPTSVTYSGEFLSSDAKIPTLFEINEGYSKNVADEGIMFRDGDSVEYNKAMARDIYEQRVSRGMYQMQEALQDSMLGLKEAMDAILKAEGNGKTYIEDVAGYENAYLGENRLSSVNQAECTAFAQTLFKPMLEEVAKLAKTADERAELTDYMMAKHGLERNEVMARRAAEKDARSEFFAEILAAQQAVDNDPLDQDAIDALEDVKQRMQDREEELYLINRERDYAGLTALTGMDNVLDAETEAQQMVSDYERDHWVDGLWDKVNAVTKATLQKTYESGLINKATYDDISGMYGNYIPLRGFDDKTSDEAYAYLTDKHSAFNAPIKTAKGRKSKADDPFANMEAMAESAIMQGNRNTLVKQKFLNFALNHPSDLVSVSDLWLWHNDVADEWQPINSGDLQGTERIEEDDSPAEVERKMRDFEYAMQQAAKNDPAHFRKQKDNPAIPYRVVESRDLRQHQVLVKRNGRDIILTINGNPRAAQALNGQTNPDNDVSGAIGAIMRLGETINRQLSAFYTTRNPDFVVSNFMRDMMYANTMVWVKESPNYAWRFHKNVAKVNPAKMKVLLAKLRNGTLDLNDETEKMFHLFMMNGGETGYANIRDIEQRKNDIKRELKKSNGQMPIRKAWDLLGERLDEYNRAVENCARFAAFMTSRQLGRTIDRSVYDAKEISVNFNKKGSGAKFWKTNGQTGIGNVAAFTSGLGRSFYVFWNAVLQGSTNFGRQFKRHPKKAIAGAAAMFLLGALMASIGGGDGDDDKDDKNDYFNLPEYVRRSNVVFRLPGMDKSWISMPLPVEYRAMYGMGELMVSAMNGKEHYTAGELAHQMASQVSQMLPIDIMEGSGGFKAFVPSAIKPIAEVIGNESWTGMPIYKDTPFNKDMPEWTKAYKSANKYLVGLSKALNEATGGDAYTSGKIDINPAQVEYLLNGIFGGVSSTIDRLTKMGETVIGDREYDPRSFLLLNRLVKNGDERTEYRAVNNEYFRIKEESEKLRTRLNHYENDTADGVFDYAEKIAWLNNSPEYRILETYEDYSGDIDDINEELKAAASDEERKGLEAELNEKKKELVDAVNNIRNGKQQ